MFFPDLLHPRFKEISFRNPLLYLLLFIKIATVIGLNYCNEEVFSDHWSKNTLLANYSGDSDAYIDPIEYFINTGNYGSRTDSHTFSGRAPYYGSIYYIFRLFIDKYQTVDLMAFLQILIDCIAGLVMAKFLFKNTKTHWTFWLTIAFYSGSFYHTDFSGRILTESLSTSALIFFSYYLLKLFHGKSRQNFIAAGTWLSIAVVLKPYFAPLYLLVFLFYDKSKTPVYNFITGVIFSLSLIVITIPFTVRNYLHYGMFQPFSSLDGGSSITEGDVAYRNYLQSVGESFIFWDPDCAGCLFTNIPIQCDYRLPERMFTENTDRATVNKAKDIYIDYLNNKTAVKEVQVINTFNALREDYRISKPFHYYFGSRLLLTYRFIIQKASYYLPNTFEGSGYYLFAAIKAFQVVIYYVIMITGFAGIFYLALKRKKIVFLLGIVPFYLILFFPVVLGAIEWRYWSGSHYFLLMSSVLFIFLVHTRFSRKKNEL